jgi:hypothetical protein
VRQNHEHIWGCAASELWDAAPTWIVVVDALVLGPNVVPILSRRTSRGKSVPKGLFSF